MAKHFLYTVFLFVFLFSCADTEKKEKTNQKEKNADKELVRIYIASKGSESLPFYSWPENEEEPKGLEPRLMTYILDQAGLDYEFVSDYEYSGDGDPRIRSVEEGYADVSIRGITINEERSQHVLFSESYYTDGLGIMVMQSSDLFKLEDLKGKKVFAYRFSTSYKWLEENLKGADLVSTEEFGLETPPYELLQKGEVAAIAMDFSALKRIQKKLPDSRLFPRKFTKEEYGIAITNKKPELKEKIDKIILEMRQSGRLADFTSGFEK